MSEIIKTGPFEGWTDIMPITETAEKKLRPCAFCGRMPKTIYAVFSFTRREVCTQVVCMHKGCPVEYTEAPVLRMFSVMEWNARPIEDARAARIAELENGNRDQLVDYENRLCEARKYQQDAVRRCEELEAECVRLRKALKEIAKFADSEYAKRIPAPSCVEFLTIKLYAEKALKGAGE